CRSLKRPPMGATAREALPYAEQIFERGPFLRVLGYLGAGHPERHYVRAAIVVALLAWLPMLVLTFVHDGFRFGTDTRLMLADAGAYARCFVALPALGPADLFCGGRLTAIARFFIHGGLIDVADRPRLEALLVSTRRWSSSPLAA